MSFIDDEEVEPLKIVGMKRHSKKLNEEITIKQNLGFDKAIKENQIDPLRELPGSPFSENKKILEAPLRELFIWTLSLGLNHENPKELIGGASDSIPHSTFERSFNAHWLARIATLFNTGNIDDLLDPSKVRKISQEYSNGGIATLFSRMRLSTDRLNVLDQLVMEHLQEAEELIEEILPTPYDEEEEIE